LSANGGGLGARTGLYKVGEIVRRLTPIECERLQSLPDNYKDCVKETKRMKAIGNGFSVVVMAHILSFIK
jgi:DNA (cytosine-5)-methyltransferase 3A